jgi:hypothetical protein
MPSTISLKCDYKGLFDLLSDNSSIKALFSNTEEIKRVEDGDRFEEHQKPFSSKIRTTLRMC